MGDTPSKHADDLKTPLPPQTQAVDVRRLWLSQKERVMSSAVSFGQLCIDVRRLNAISRFYKHPETSQILKFAVYAKVLSERHYSMLWRLSTNFAVIATISPPPPPHSPPPPRSLPSPPSPPLPSLPPPFPSQEGEGELKNQEVCEFDHPLSQSQSQSQSQSSIPIKPVSKAEKKEEEEDENDENDDGFCEVNNHQSIASASAPSVAVAVKRYKLSVPEFYHLFLHMDDYLPLACGALEKDPKKVRVDNPVVVDIEETPRGPPPVAPIVPEGDGNGDECSICLDLAPSVCLPCAHDFCSKCIEEWNIVSQTCPMCRSQLEGINPLRESWELTKDDAFQEEVLKDVQMFPCNYVKEFPIYNSKKEGKVHLID